MRFSRSWSKRTGRHNVNATEIATVVAAATSVLALWLSWRANARSARNEKKSNEIQQQLLGIEEEREAKRDALERRADVVVALEAYPSSSGRTAWRLRLRNGGRCEAREVNVTLNGDSIFEPNHPIGAERPEAIGAGGTWACPLATASGFNPPWNAEVTWQDESGEPGRHRTTLTF